MARDDQDRDGDLDLILGLLNAVEDDAQVTQRSLADRLGVALGLTNAYLKRCVKKGWIKVHEIPARRYAYYLTPTGFAEKSRLMAEYLSSGFSFFRQAREDCTKCLRAAQRAGRRRVVLVGGGELAEVAAITASELDVELIGVVAPGLNQQTVASIPVLQSLDDAPSFDAVMITDIKNAQATYEGLCDAVDADRILSPDLLNISVTWPDDLARVQRGAAQ